MTLVKCLEVQPQGRPNTGLRVPIWRPMNPLWAALSLELGRDFVSCSGLRHRTPHASTHQSPLPLCRYLCGSSCLYSLVSMAPSEPLSTAVSIMEVEMVTDQAMWIHEGSRARFYPCPQAALSDPISGLL